MIIFLFLYSTDEAVGQTDAVCRNWCYLQKITAHNSSTVNKHNELRSDKQDVRC